MNENILPTVAVIVRKLLKKSEIGLDFFTNNSRQFNQSLVQNRYKAPLSYSSFEKFSTALCLLIFFAVNLLLYVCPIPS